MEYKHKLQRTSHTLSVCQKHQSAGVSSLKEHDIGVSRQNLENGVSAKEVVQRMVVVVEHDYNRIKEPRIWNNVRHAETLAGGPVWDLGKHREPEPDEREGKQLRFVNHGTPGAIGSISAQDLYALMTGDPNGLNVMRKVESVVFQSCYAAKDKESTEDNLTFSFAQLIALDSRLEREKGVAVYGKRQISFGFGGIGDACAVLEDSKFNTRLVAINDRESEEGSMATREIIPAHYEEVWKNFFEQNKGGWFSRRRVIKTKDGAEEGWQIPENAGNALIRKYITEGGQVYEEVSGKGRRATSPPGQDVMEFLALISNLK